MNDGFCIENDDSYIKNDDFKNGNGQFFGFPSKEEEDVKGACVLALTQSSGDGRRQRLLFVYTGLVQRSLKGSERFKFINPCVNVRCLPGASASFSAEYMYMYTMGRQQNSGFRVITVADQLVDVYSSESTEMSLHKQTARMMWVPTQEDLVCTCISCVTYMYWCIYMYGPCLDLCTFKPCCKVCGQKSCCEPETKSKKV